MRKPTSALPLWRRLLGLCISAALAVAVVVSTAAAGAQASPVAREAAVHHVATEQRPTRVVVYEPWTRAGLARGIGVAVTGRGYCWVTALASPRPDAYRCAVPSELFDPCFADRYASRGYGVVACPDPGPARVAIIELTKPLPRSSPPTTLTWPWLIILTSGLRCYYVTGAALYTKGIGRQNYTCGTGNGTYGAGGLWSLPRHGRTWTILYQSRLGGPFTRVPIAAVYE